MALNSIANINYHLDNVIVTAFFFTTFVIRLISSRFSPHNYCINILLINIATPTVLSRE